MWTNDELAYVLYNNRSVKGVVSNFLVDEKINPFLLNRVESILEKSKISINPESRMVEIHKNELNLDCDDVNITKYDLESLTSLIKENVGNFNNQEYEYLINRGMGDETILKWSILGLSSIKNKRDLETIGATCHPILSSLLMDGIENGGIIIPLFEDGKLVNCAIRKINSSKSLKYTLSCPDVPVWGIDNISPGDDIWLSEGLFDMMAISKSGKKAVSCSSAMWSGIQLYKVVEKRPKSINIFSDNDQVGIRTSAILKRFFEFYKIECRIFISRWAKDAAEHIFQKERYLAEVVEIKSIESLLETKFDDSFDFLKYLKNRKY